MSSSNVNHLFAPTGTVEPEDQDPGAYPIPFRAPGVLPGTRLDSIPDSLRYWAISEERSDAEWYEEMVTKNAEYEEWLCRDTAGAYRVPFGQNQGKRLDKVDDNFRYWAVDLDRSESVWYESFVKFNDRYEEELAASREPGDFPLPANINKEYRGIPIKDVPQDAIWWGLRDGNHPRGWYKPLYEANRRFLDEKYESCSPGSETFWFGQYCGLRLDQVCQRRGYMRWCLDPARNCGWHYRLKDLVRRLEEWQLAHPERHRPRQPRHARNIENPVGEAIGSRDDDAGSADEDDEYELDDFVRPDSDGVEYEGDGSDGDGEGGSREYGEGDGEVEHGGVDGEDEDGLDVAMHDEVTKNSMFETDEEGDEKPQPPSPKKHLRSRRKMIFSDDEDSNNDAGEDANRVANDDWDKVADEDANEDTVHDCNKDVDDSDEERSPKRPAKRRRNEISSEEEDEEDSEYEEGDGGEHDVGKLGRQYRVPHEDSDEEQVPRRKSTRLRYKDRSKLKRQAPHSSQ